MLWREESRQLQLAFDQHTKDTEESLHSICSMVEDVATMTKQKEVNLNMRVEDVNQMLTRQATELKDQNLDMAQLRKVTTDVSNGMKMLVEVWQQK